MQIQDNQVLAQIRHLERSMENFPTDLMMIDLTTGKRIYGHSPLENLLGYSFKEWSHDPLIHLRIIHPLDLEADQQLRARAKVAKPDELNTLFYRVYHKDGRLLLYSLYNLPLTYSQEGLVKLSLSIGKVIMEVDPELPDDIAIHAIPFPPLTSKEDQINKDNFIMFVNILRMRLKLLEQSSEDFI